MREVRKGHERRVVKNSIFPGRMSCLKLEIQEIAVKMLLETEFKTRKKKVKSVKKWKPTENGNQRVGKNGMKAYKIPHKLCDILLYLHVGAILIKN